MPTRLTVMAGPPRYALYAVPRPESALARFGARWLGWDIETGSETSPLETARLPAALHTAVTNEPRRYGFHGTLKAPFRLVEGWSEGDLVAAAAEFAARRTAPSASPLLPQVLGSFLALCTRERSPEIDSLASECVVWFERFRAPLTEAEVSRRRLGNLSLAQDELLVRWGYPFVFDEFRFHMTLTGSLDAELRTRVSAALAPRLEDILGAPFELADLVLVVEPEPRARFRVLRRFPLGG
jgi:putative phosphonate metabolism protein